jgi:hypothetical protein
MTASREEVSFLKSALLAALCVVLLCLPVLATPEIETSDDQTTVIVNDAPEQDIIAFGKSVLVKKRAKGVLAVGGDVIVEGRVEGDVATVGGNVIQKESAYIGGDVFVVGGAYKPESQTPLRAEGRETVMFGVFEEELRSLAQNPAQILTPSFTVSFLAQRLVIALFWFIISLAFTTLAPGAVGRAVARVQLSSLKISAIGAGTIMLLGILVIGSTILLPGYLSTTLFLMGMMVLFLGFVFGRVILQVSTGKLIQKHLLSGDNRSEALATLLGVLAWTLILSLPYIWLFGIFAIFIVGLGLVLTGRTGPRWQTP